MNINDIEMGNPLGFEVDKIIGNIICSTVRKYVINILGDGEIISIEVTPESVTHFVHKNGIADPIIIQSCSTEELACGYLTYRGYSKQFIDFIRTSIRQLKEKVT